MDSIAYGENLVDVRFAKARFNDGVVEVEFPKPEATFKVGLFAGTYEISRDGNVEKGEPEDAKPKTGSRPNDIHPSYHLGQYGDTCEYYELYRAF